MSSIKAYIENIIYYNEDNYYAVLEASAGSSLITLVGHFPYISAGESIEAEGEYTSHPVYGEQFSVSSFQVTAPEGADAIERYLAGGAIRGIGPALAKRIVKKFKADTFRIIEEEPDAPAGLPLRVQACEGQQGGDQPVQPFHAQDLVPDEFPDHFQQHLPFSSRTQERRIASMESRKLIHSPQFRE